MTATPHQFECIVDLWLAGREPKAIWDFTGIPCDSVIEVVSCLRMMGRPRVSRALVTADGLEAFAASLRRQTRRSVS